MSIALRRHDSYVVIWNLRYSIYQCEIVEIKNREN